MILSPSVPPVRYASVPLREKDLRFAHPKKVPRRQITLAFRSFVVKRFRLRGSLSTVESNMSRITRLSRLITLATLIIGFAWAQQPPSASTVNTNDLAAAVSSLQKTVQQLQTQIAQLQQLTAHLKTTARANTILPTAAAPAAIATAEADFEPDDQTSSENCGSQSGLPDHACTPGAVMTRDLDTICHTSTRDRRFVPREVKLQAYAMYGISFPQPTGSFELDHLIPLELGGDNLVENLWPEPAEPRPGFHEKDKVENFLHKQVCSGAMSLAEAQRIIATDWLTFSKNNMQ
jgi:hypothetical protein